MNRAVPFAFPVRDLREHVTAFEAALTVTLADPGVEPVHRLRTCSRRIEAQLVLLGLLSGLPDHDREARRAARSLAKVRATAGEVRDLDVLRKLVKTMASGDGSLDDDARVVRRALKRKRAERSVWLIHTVEGALARVVARLEALLEVLAPAGGCSVPAGELAAISQGWFVEHAPAATDVEPDDTERLHEIRKAAKIARYLAEGATSDDERAGNEAAASPGEGADVVAVAGSFEQVQQAGGEWHDLVLLAEIARKRLGASSPLVSGAERARDEARSAYQRELTALPRDPSRGGR